MEHFSYSDFPFMAYKGGYKGKEKALPGGFNLPTALPGGLGEGRSSHPGLWTPAGQ